MGNVRNMELLDIWCNQLTGEIPMTLTNLNFLDVFIWAVMYYSPENPNGLRDLLKVCHMSEWKEQTTESMQIVKEWISLRWFCIVWVYNYVFICCKLSELYPGLQRQWGKFTRSTFNPLKISILLGTNSNNFLEENNKYN